MQKAILKFGVPRRIFVDNGCRCSFLHRISRKVTPTATVSLFNVSYEVPQHYIGKTIHLRCRPEDLSEIYVYEGEGGKRLYTAKPVKKLDNAKRKRRANISYSAMDGCERNV